MQNMTDRPWTPRPLDSPTDPHPQSFLLSRGRGGKAKAEVASRCRGC